jgi:hypothetical protein
MSSTNKTVTNTIDVEQSIHELVTVNGGAFSDEQVADLFSKNCLLQEDNIKRRTWIHALTGLVIFLGIFNVASLLVAIRVSKSTLVNPTSGALTIPGSNACVSAVAAGEEHVITMQDDHRCVNSDEMERMWNSAMAGTPASALQNFVDKNQAIVSMGFPLLPLDPPLMTLTRASWALMGTRLRALTLPAKGAAVVPALSKVEGAAAGSNMDSKKKVKRKQDVLFASKRGPDVWPLVNPCLVPLQDRLPLFEEEKRTVASCAMEWNCWRKRPTQMQTNEVLSKTDRRLVGLSF